MKRGFDSYSTVKHRNKLCGALRCWVAFMAVNTRPVITTASSPHLECGVSNLKTRWYDEESVVLQRVPDCLVYAEVILGLLVWPLIASTEYFRFSPFGWVMFVTVLYWLLTLFLLIINMANVQPQNVPWTTVVLIYNCTAALLYTSAAIVEATLVNQVVKGHHNFNCWAASTFFSFLASLSYAGSAFFSYISWKREG